MNKISSCTRISVLFTKYLQYLPTINDTEQAVHTTVCDLCSVTLNSKSVVTCPLELK